MEIFLTITYMLLFLFLIQRMRFFEVDGISRRGMILLFLLKIVAGFAVWAVYTYYYTDRLTADIYKYFDDSKVIFDTLWEKPVHFFQLITGIGNNSPEFDHYYSEMNFWARKVDSGIYNDSHTIIRFNAVLRLFSLGYYHIHTVVMCFLSFVGLTAIYKTFSGPLADRQKALMIAVFLLPSVLFWSSGVLKEGLIFFALGLLVHHSLRLFSLRSVFICVAATLLLALSKFYVWLCIMPGIFFLVSVLKSSSRRLLAKFLSVFALFAILGSGIDLFTDIQDPLVTLSQKRLEFDQLAAGQFTDADHRPIPPANSVIALPKLEPTLASFLANAPQALLNTLFRPYPWEMKGPMMVLAGLEILLLTLFILCCLICSKAFKDIAWEYVLFCLSFVLLQFLIIGETTPILGALARYRTIALPFLAIGFLFILDKRKLPRRLPFLKRIFNS